MLKQNFHQQQSSGSGFSGALDHELTTMQAEVFELVNEENAQTSLLLKLTDECNAAIKHAVKHKFGPVRLHVENGEATIEVPDIGGNTLKFKCSSQNQPATDVICFDHRRKFYRNIGLTSSAKLQVQATDKTFAEMKEKTQRLVEAEQQRKAKDMTQKTTVLKGHQKPQNHHTIIQQLRDRGRQLTSTTATTMTNANSIRSKFGAATATSVTKKRTHSPSPYSKVVVPPKRRELDVPSTNKEMITAANRKSEQKANSFHSVPTAITNTNGIRRESVEKEICAIAKPISGIAKEQITASQYPKYDPSANGNNKKDLFYIPKRKSNQQHAPSISPASTTTSTPKTISPPLAMPRPASVDSSLLQHSSSCSPEDTALGHDEQQHQVGSVTLPTKPSQDWTVEFAKIVNNEEAKRYQTIFKTDYPEYRQCYEELERVANEFRALQEALKGALDQFERSRIETQIRSKFAAYQCDQEFLRKRQRHHDLRAKLEVIKHALMVWNTRIGMASVRV